MSLSSFSRLGETQVKAELFLNDFRFMTSWLRWGPYHGAEPRSRSSGSFGAESLVDTPLLLKQHSDEDTDLRDKTEAVKPLLNGQIQTSQIDPVPGSDLEVAGSFKEARGQPSLVCTLGLASSGDGDLVSLEETE